jgi:hypothetical protein
MFSSDQSEKPHGRRPAAGTAFRLFREGFKKGVGENG